jgi:hypothetical protein
LPVISREGNAQNVSSVTNESAGGDSVVQVPKAEGLIPRGGKAKLAVGGDGKILDEVVVSKKPAPGETVVFNIACEVPDDDTLIS